MSLSWLIEWYLSEYFFSRLDSEYHTHECEDDCEYKSNPESIYRKSWDESRDEEYHEDIDDDGNETEREDIEREGKGFQEWTDSTIDYGEYYCHDDSGHISVYTNSWYQICCYRYRYAWDEYIEENIHKKKVKNSHSYYNFEFIYTKKNPRQIILLSYNGCSYYFFSQFTIQCTPYLSVPDP